MAGNLLLRLLPVLDDWLPTYDVFRYRTTEQATRCSQIELFIDFTWQIVAVDTPLESIYL